MMKEDTERACEVQMPKLLVDVHYKHQCLRCCDTCVQSRPVAAYPERLYCAAVRRNPAVSRTGICDLYAKKNVIL
jgi:hypothetical protein